MVTTSIAVGELCEQAQLELIRHLARLFGTPPEALDEDRVSLVRGRVSESAERANRRGPRILVNPDPDSCGRIGLERTLHESTNLPFKEIRDRAWSAASLHEYQSFVARDGRSRSVLVDHAGRHVWVEVDTADGRWLVIGTDLGRDLLRFRQGDPARAAGSADHARWGFSFERPNHLFESQLLGIDSRRRHADLWSEVFAANVALLLRVRRRSMLPHGAPGALVITGDDDQAYLEKYAVQLKETDGLPMTYFMHPLTRHDRASARRMFGRRRVELGIHPDALHAPSEYASRVVEQAAEFENRFGFKPVSIRNHGYLNDGYWGHLRSWRKLGIRVSSNIPGLDGKVLNGSMIPARVALNGELTDHWSILTTFGDGMVFALGMSDEDAASRMRQYAADVAASGLPGVMVVNLHPQNVDECRAMHRVLREIVRMGFQPWTLADCWRWFAALDSGSSPRPFAHAAATTVRRLMGVHT